MPSVWCEAGTGANSIIWAKGSCSFSCLHSEEKNCAIGDAVNITWQECLYQWHHMTGKVSVSPHFDHGDIIDAVVPLIIPVGSQRYI